MYDTGSQATEAVRRAIGAQIVVLFGYAVYGIGFGLLAVLVGSSVGFFVAMVGAAHLAFGALATLQRSTALPTTRAKYAALAVTHTIALLWGLGVTIQVSREDPLASLILGAIHLPLPIAGISLLSIPSVFRFYWTGRLPSTG
ncbi:MAG: hypothetical protein ACK6D3_19495 [Planctomycetaceae bacterium]|jgi:hypothetical protein